jgi:hypothetical protein
MVEIDLGGCDHFQELQAAVLEAAKFIADPDIAQAVDGEAATGKASLEGFNLRRIIGRNPGDVLTDDVRDPNIVLLVYRERERCDEHARVFERTATLVLTQQFALCRITFGEMNYLPFHRVERPDVTIGGCDDALHLPKLAVEVPACGRRQWLPGVIELRDRLSLEARHPDVVSSIEGETEARATDAPASEAA